MPENSFHSLDRSQLSNRIRLVFEEVAKDGEKEFALRDEDSTVLLNSGLDSLDFAIIVARLEDDLDVDPFAASDDAFYPKTFGDFVDFYFKNMPESKESGSPT
ncbi:acyl carrier protein [Crateriforma conspicua]|uniref:acyl carrier protein n=1 Tax=Crateriforma conspicua TaxID=2527996 RepID=UPI00118BF3F8|nr:acyl carrier protein [Crateriforma conspicua]QDV65135.1 hypothetical protein Mal65_43050 [Crateriforma conspicua]